MKVITAAKNSENDDHKNDSTGYNDNGSSNRDDADCDSRYNIFR